MTGLDAAGHLAYALLILGQLRITHKHRDGFLLRAVGSASWGVLGWHMGYSSIALWSSAFALVDLRGFWLWGKPPVKYLVGSPPPPPAPRPRHLPR